MDMLCSGFGLVESPRWHDGRLWFSDWTGGRIVAVDDAGATEVVVEHRSLPMCFDFLPDGRLVLVSNQEQRAATLEDDGTLAPYADLSRALDLRLQRHRRRRPRLRLREQPATSTSPPARPRATCSPASSGW